MAQNRLRDVLLADLVSKQENVCLTMVSTSLWKRQNRQMALLFGSPVYYANASGQISAFLDRTFYGKSAIFEGKPGAAVVSCRRAGSTASLDQLNKYFTISGMPVVSSRYWNMVHGNTPDEVRQDKEGLQIMRTLGNNMAWLLKCIELGRENGGFLSRKKNQLKRQILSDKKKRCS